MTLTSSKDAPPLLTLFVACYNEEDNIKDTLDTLVEACSEVKISYEIIVIDDASSDASVEILKKYAEDNPAVPLHVHVNEQNQGLGANFIEGAFLGTGQWYRLICGDNVETKDTFVRIFSQIGAADILIPYHSHLIGRSPFRIALSKVYTGLVNWISGHRVNYYNGMCVTRRQWVMRWHSSSHGFGFQADLVTRLLSRGATYIQIPVVGQERAHGESKALTFKNLCSVLHSLLNIFIRRVSVLLYGRC
jgi:glycosyltransferase involved in cell wall biosynthesis